MRDMRLKTKTASLLLCSCLLLGACDARQWPLADKMSGGPPAAAKPTVAKGTGAAQGQSAANQASAPAPRKPAAVKPVQVAPSETAAAAPAPPPAAQPVPASLPAMPPTLDGKTDLNLVGLNNDRARELLGAPAAEVQRPPARIWRYRYPHCTLDVTFYPDVKTKEFRVLSYEVIFHDGSEQLKRDCRNDLRARTSRSAAR